MYSRGRPGQRDRRGAGRTGRAAPRTWRRRAEPGSPEPAPCSGACSTGGWPSRRRGWTTGTPARGRGRPGRPQRGHRGYRRTAALDPGRRRALAGGVAGLRPAQLRPVHRPLAGRRAPGPRRPRRSVRPAAARCALRRRRRAHHPVPVPRAPRPAAPDGLPERREVADDLGRAAMAFPEAGGLGRSGLHDMLQLELLNRTGVSSGWPRLGVRPTGLAATFVDALPGDCRYPPHAHTRSHARSRPASGTSTEWIA